MARNLDRVMTWAQACECFESEILPLVREHHEQDGIPDWPARREAWNNWTDSLCKDRQISDWQYENWDHPPCIQAERPGPVRARTSCRFQPAQPARICASG
jgi:hypothetical protein